MEIIDRTSETAGHVENKRGFPIISRYGRTRPLAAVDAIMLHQMAMDRGNDLSGYDMVIYHYAVTLNGTIALLRPLETLLNEARARKSVHVAFVGSFPSTVRGGPQTPTLAQVRAGRWLIRHIAEDCGLNIRHIVAHRHWTYPGRANDPGPHIWYNVALWAQHTLGLRDDLIGPNGRGTPPEWESPRFDVDARGFGNTAGWRAFLRHPSRAMGVKLHDGGIIGIYRSAGDAQAELLEGRAWSKADGTWECWIRRRSAAIEAELIGGGIAGFYANERAATTEADSNTLASWPTRLDRTR